ncbi:MAG TPA: hypothetical protein DEQ85_01510 [Clostridiales bacterium]|nr:hypothetical protein [Clostridiales bacterium]
MNEQESLAIASELAQCVQKNRDCRTRITKEAYVPAFEAFEADCASALNAFEQSGASETALGEQVLQALAAQWQTLGKQEQALSQEADRIVLALFLIPAIRRRETDRAESLAAALQSAWQTRFPQSRFQLVRFESIANGFQKKLFKACYITTAVCRMQEKPDDCAELTAFRRFRDGYLARQPDGDALIAEYYETAPGILACIELCTDAPVRLDRIWQEHLKPCYEALIRGDEQTCKTRYVQMVRTLQREYLGTGVDC